MFRPWFQADFLESGERFRSGFGPGDAPDQQRHHDVLEGGELRQQVVNLPNEPNLPVAKTRSFGVGERGNLFRAKPDGAVCGPVQAPQQVKKGGLAGARFAYQSQPLAVPDFQVQALKHHQLARAGAVLFAQPGSPYGNVRRHSIPYSYASTAVQHALRVWTRHSPLA